MAMRISPAPSALIIVDSVAGRGAVAGCYLSEVIAFWHLKSESESRSEQERLRTNVETVSRSPTPRHLDIDSSILIALVYGTRCGKQQLQSNCCSILETRESHVREYRT